MTWTPVLAIEKRLEIREIRSQRKKEFDAADAIDKNKEDLLESYLLMTMNERGEEQIKTEAGTAYKSPQIRVNMVDRAAVIQYTLDQLEKGVSPESAFGLFTNNVSKEGVKTLLELNITPPGIKI